MQMKNVFIHHVYFWLKESNDESKSELVAGLKKLSAVTAIRDYHIGIPADTNREVIEKGYDVSWMLVFANDSDQASYQVDPVHLKFVEECSTLWSKVQVYDSVDAG